MPRSVLLVDDEPNIAFSLEYLMKRDGYEVRVAGDGEAALDSIRAQKPDLILLDVMMPKRDGYDVCQTVRADPRYADVKIIVLTAKGGALDGEKALALGADAFFSKPFGLEELSCRVKELLAESPGDDG
ncbi:response regulator [Paralimibaculum aggregatum]|uniref:Response regulator n=1 Tax=Paralimibaculum aggregatum TaxID=3036245 RepID=A0ABQ6LHB9_9RHOB|nr:response regulator [Limibaculum sp. NKW23]GMG81037.1 response regulator [Limibaculum sp. NKW23]